MHLLHKANICQRSRPNEITFNVQYVKLTGLDLSSFVPVEGDQRDGSPPRCAFGGKELSGAGRFPLSEQVRPCTSSHIDRSPRSEGRSSPSACSRHSNCLEKRTAEGNTALHYSVLHHKPESLKLLLKAKATLHTGDFLKGFLGILFPPRDFTAAIPSSYASPAVNSAGETALDTARRLQHTQCVDLVRCFGFFWTL